MPINRKKGKFYPEKVCVAESVMQKLKKIWIWLKINVSHFETESDLWHKTTEFKKNDYNKLANNIQTDQLLFLGGKSESILTLFCG